MKITSPLVKLTKSCIILLLIIATGCVSTRPHKLYPERENETAKENDMYDGPDKAAQFEFNRTKDPATGIIPRGSYVAALNKTTELKVAAGFGPGSTNQFGAGWVERGPTSDVVGSSNGNTRANSGVASGRIRAVLVDAADATKKTVWVGGVDGGLWKTTDITVSPANWTLVNDYMSNLAIADIVQQPGNPNNMFLCTGEGYFNIDAVGGNGVFKSTDHGVTWTQIASTTGWSANRIQVDAAGNIYVATAAAGSFTATGLQRSTDGGNNWVNITPTGSSSRIADMELSSTGRMHIATGLGNSTVGMYRYTDNPATVTSAGWTASATAFPYPSGANCRVELGCNGNVLYALPSNTAAQVATIYKSTDGGANWAATASQPAAGWASAQAWYSLGVDIDPSDPTNGCIVGGLDPYKTTNGGTTWTKIADWTNNASLPPLTTQYVHADIHKIVWYDNGNKLIFACDGGIHYSSDKGVTIRDRNIGLRIKQFYSCAIHPSTTNYFIAGAQDNGNHKFTNAGLSSTEEFIGGDGAFTAIDQNEAQFQFAAYVFSVYRKSTDGGATWSTVNWSSSVGQFINPWDYDNTGNRIYGCWSAGQYFRWDDPQSGTTASAVTVAAFNSAVVSTVHVSPYTTNQVYFGTAAGRVVRVTNAQSATPTGTNITGAGMPAGANLSCVNTGTDDNNLIACFSNYGVASVWVSSNGGTNWTSLDNNGVNLPDMPVRWCMFYPGDNTRAILATETGIWETDLINGTSTVWVANTSFPTVRTDMLEYRSADGILAAATHGRGLWTTTINDMRTADFRTKGTDNYSTTGNWEFNTYGSVYLDARSIPAAGNNVQVQAGHTLTLDANHVVNTGKTFTVNGTLNCGTNTISGAGGFTTAAASTLGIGSTAGITASGATGNIQTSTRTYSTSGNYTYNGANNQAAGNGLPANINNLIIANTGAAADNIVTLSGSVAVNGSTTLSAGILSIASNTLTINGTVSGSGTFTGSASGGVSASNLVIGGTALNQTFNFTQTTAATRSLNNLSLSSGSSATLGTALDVYGTITLTTASLNLNAKNLTLKSNSSGTARVANLTGSALSGATNVTVERYIKLRSPGTGDGAANNGRAYRLLAPVVNTSGSLRANWMEGGMNTAIGTNVNPVPNFGTQVSGAGGNTNGFDVTQTNQSSLFATTNAVTPTYTAIGNTNGTLNALSGYFLYIRGDRSMNMQVPLGTNMPTSHTTLRATGSLVTGTQTSFTNAFVGGGALNLVTNPYPSPIDWALVQPACSNIGNAYTLWDPNVGTRGGFVTVTTAGVVSGGGTATRFIQPGQAFFVQSTGGVPAVSIQESHKSAGNNNTVFIIQPPAPESFQTALYFKEDSGYRRFSDGITVLYDRTYSKSLDANDATEINNWDENIAVDRNGKHLAIESRPVIKLRDTIPLFMNNMKVRSYEFEFVPASFSNAGLNVELVDRFLGTRRLLSVLDTTVVPFSITTDPASSATDRFMIVFGPKQAPAIDVLTIRAAAAGKSVQVDWEAASETDMDHYELERSADGTAFRQLYRKPALESEERKASYTYLDVNPGKGVNYYRVKAVSKAGLVKYTDKIRVNSDLAVPDISIFPNPSAGSLIGIQFTDMEKGSYQVTIVNKAGQAVYKSQVQHAGGSAIITVRPGVKIDNGAYEMILMKESYRISKHFIVN